MSVRVGLIGCGNMGVGLIKACLQIENADVAGVSDPISEKAEKLADELNNLKSISWSLPNVLKKILP